MKETVGHVLFQCEFLENLRYDITTESPSQILMQEMTNMTQEQLVVFTGLQNTYVLEWNNMYKAMARFIAGIYHRRDELCKLQLT